jgi:SAM-dependent methyltransferase
VSLQEAKRVKIARHFRCPACGSAEVSHSAYFHCAKCGSAADHRADPPPTSDPLDRLKDRVKRRFPRLYPNLISLLGPVHSTPIVRNFLETRDLASELILNLGSGCEDYDPSIVNVDLQPYATVDLVCSIADLPLKSSSVDAVLIIAVLEHVPDPEAIVKEIHRVLKAGGQVCCFVPFMQGIHASPDDFQRYTPQGLTVLFGEFVDASVEVSCGPTSGLVWLLQEWLAMALSFRSTTLYWFFYSVFFVLAPLKYLDVLLRKHPMARNIASGFTITATKAASSSTAVETENADAVGRQVRP